MRKWVLLAAGLMVSGGLLFGMFRSAAAQYSPREEIQSHQMPEKTLTFPCKVEGTELTAVELAEYEGPFWEDGSGEELAGVCALVIENNGGTTVYNGLVTLEIGDRLLEFEFSWLLPGARVLVPERGRARFKPGLRALSCRGWSTGIYPEYSGAVTAEGLPGGYLRLVNHTTQTVSHVSVVYKSYDEESGLYIGGISRSLDRSDLRPGEMRQVLAPYYAETSKVVGVLVGNDS